MEIICVGASGSLLQHPCLHVCVCAICVVTVDLPMELSANAAVEAGYQHPVNII